MPRASKATASIRQEIPGAVSLSEEFPGGWTVNFETEHADVDTASYAAGLPGGQCQTPHLGYVLAGRIVYRTAQGEEVFEAGDAYYVAPGHTTFVHAGTEYVEFSPSEQQRRTYAHAVGSYRDLVDRGEFPIIAAP